jgi:hypothetical protein
LPSFEPHLCHKEENVCSQSSKDWPFSRSEFAIRVSSPCRYCRKPTDPIVLSPNPAGIRTQYRYCHFPNNIDRKEGLDLQSMRCHEDSCTHHRETLSRTFSPTPESLDEPSSRVDLPYRRVTFDRPIERQQQHWHSSLCSWTSTK